MTPKEKALELLYKFSSEANCQKIGKQCALICVEEIIEIMDWTNIYWQEVKCEIQKL